MPELRVAFLQEIRDDGARDRALPSFQGADLAFATAALGVDPPAVVDVVPVDPTADPGAVEAIVGDPSFVAVIAGPGLRARSIPEDLSAAGLAVIDLSPVGRPVDGEDGAWRRLVPTLREQARELAAIAATLPGIRRGACLLEDPERAVGLLGPMARALTIGIVLHETVRVASAGEVAREAGCRIVAVDGDAEGAAGAALDLADVVPRAALLGGDRLRYPPFLSEAGDAAEGTISVCGCADLSLSTDLADQRFIQDFQSAYGRAPGPYAVEGWDAAGAVLGGLRTVGPTRIAVTAWIATLGDLTGLGGRYAFDERGELSGGAVRVAEVRGGRWVPLGV